ncbi:MAG: hypothetical protein KGY45_03755, partial [Hadesarchaea archaeon]|nr:hypothetical protein [Hadesarchaea archaeon]
RRVNIRAYLDPLPKKKLIKSLDAPDHIVNKKIDYLVRRGVLSERRVYSCRGRTVQKIKPKKKPRWLGGLERKIVEKANKHYEVQKNALDIMQDAN